MSAEDELQLMMDFYPEIFPTRKHCLDHLFCVIGNGYKWVNGELVDDDNEYHKRYKVVKHVKRTKGKDEDYFNMRIAEENRLKEILKETYQLNTYDMKYNFSWYTPSKEYSYIYNYPENIKPDWLEILNECKRLLTEDGF